MNHPSRLALFFGAMLLAAAGVFASTAAAYSAGEPATLSSSQVLALQGPPVTYTLTIHLVGNGSVTKNPSNTQYLSGTVVALTAVPDPGATFVNWSGALSGSTNPQNITMTSNKEVTATFTTAVCYTLTTGVNPSGSGTVNASPGPNCNGGTQYGSGTTIDLTAVANSGFAFSSWTGVSGSTTLASLVITGTKAVTANFVPCFNLTTNVNPAGTGSVTVNTAANCGAQYKQGTVVSLTAVPHSGYAFSSWNGASGSTSAGSVTMNGNTTVTANFSLIPVTQPSATPTSTTQPAATGTPIPPATITPILGGVAAAATITPTPSSALPTTGSSPLTLIALGMGLVLLLFVARFMRQSST